MFAECEGYEDYGTRHGAGEYAIIPPGVWHIAHVAERAAAIFIA